MQQSRKDIVAWVAVNILPHEREARAWLRRSGTREHDIDDLIQDAYCRIAALSAVSHILNGRAYLFQTLRNIAIEKIRRSRVVRIDSVTEIDSLNVIDGEPSPERIAFGRMELARVNGFIEGLPDRCREIFKLRRVQGMPQRDVAQLLGVTENVVEMQTARGLRLVLQALTAGEDRGSTAKAAPAHEPVKGRPHG